MRAVPQPRCECGATMGLQCKGLQAWIWECPKCGRTVVDQTFELQAQECPPGTTLRELRLAQCAAAIKWLTTIQQAAEPAPLALAL